MGRNAKVKQQRRRERQRVAALTLDASSTAVADCSESSAGFLWLHLVLICGLACISSIFLIESEDIFSNIVTGEYLWKTKAFPETDPFSFTGPFRWLINRPLPCLIFYGAHSLGGLPAVQLLCGVVIAATYGLLYVVWSNRTRQPVAAFGITALVVMASCYWFQTRIYVFAYLYVVISLLLVTAKSQTVMWWAIPLQVLWINSHPSAILGVFFAVVWWFVESCKQRRFSPYPTTVVVGVICANVLSPMGLEAYGKFAEELFSAHPSRENIFEWFSPFSTVVASQTLAWWFYATCIVMGVLAVVVFLSGTRLRIPAVLLVITGALFTLALGSSRHIPLFYLALCSALTIATSWWIQERRIAIHSRVAGLMALCVLVAILKVAFVGYSNGPVKRTVEFGIDPHKFPERAIQIIKEAQVEGNVFSDYDTGAYFLYRMYPEYKVYIDGARLDEVYGEEWFLHYMRLGNDREVLKGDIHKYDIRAFIVPLPREVSEIVQVHRFLSVDPDWKLAYFDDVNMLFVHREEAQRRSIPTYAFLNPFVSIDEVIKKNPDAASGFERDFKQGDIVNPESIAFLILKHGYYKLRGWNDKTADITKKMEELCSRRKPSPACALAVARFGLARSQAS
jgi:hypothetical protein